MTSSSTLSFAKISTKLTYFCDDSFQCTLHKGTNLMPNNRMDSLRTGGLLILISGFFLFPACAQVLSGGQDPITRADTLRGSLRPERSEEHTSELQSRE